MFSCKFCDIFKNTFFTEHLCATASVSSIKRSWNCKVLWLFRGNRPEVFCKKGLLRNLTKFTRKHLCQSLFFNKVTGLRSATLLKSRLWHRSFPVNLVKFLRIPFYLEHLWWLLLAIVQRFSLAIICGWYYHILTELWNSIDVDLLCRGYEILFASTKKMKYDFPFLYCRTRVSFYSCK